MVFTLSLESLQHICSTRGVSAEVTPLLPAPSVTLPPKLACPSSRVRRLAFTHRLYKNKGELPAGLSNIECDLKQA